MGIGMLWEKVSRSPIGISTKISDDIFHSDSTLIKDKKKLLKITQLTIRGRSFQKKYPTNYL